MAELSEITYPLKCVSLSCYVRVPVDLINAKFGLTQEDSLIFVNENKSGLLEYNFIESRKFQRGLSQGIVYLSARHDLSDHLRGFFRLAKTQAWRDTKKLLKELFAVVDTNASSEEDGQLATRTISSVADLIENVTTDLTHEYRYGSRFRPGHPLSYKHTLRQFSSEIQTMILSTRELVSRHLSLVQAARVEASKSAGVLIVIEKLSAQDGANALNALHFTDKDREKIRRYKIQSIEILPSTASGFPEVNNNILLVPAGHQNLSKLRLPPLSVSGLLEWARDKCSSLLDAKIK